MSCSMMSVLCVVRISCASDVLYLLSLNILTISANKRGWMEFPNSSMTKTAPFLNTVKMIPNKHVHPAQLFTSFNE